MEDLFTAPIPEYGNQMSVREFRQQCESGELCDYDGFAHPIRGGNMNPYIDIGTTDFSNIPDTADGVVWLSRYVMERGSHSLEDSI